MAVPPAFRKRKIAGTHQMGGSLGAASLTTAIAGSNNDLVYTAKNRGTTGNAIRVRYVVSGASTPLSVSVSSNDITVNVATDGASAPTSTAAQVSAAVTAHGTAGGLVTVANAASNDGTGVVAAMGFSALTGGRDRVVGR